MSLKVSLIDYGVGNLLNVARAFQHIGTEVVIVESGDALIHADRVVLPGVGAFPDGMRELEARGFVEPLIRFAAHERPMMGICLGMQMLLESSNEFTDTRGLGLIAGSVVAIPQTGVDGRRHKVPHIGWNSLEQPAGTNWYTGLFSGLHPRSAMYFVHSFMAQPADPAHRLANYDYDGVKVCAAVQRGNLFGCQFHPEKSGETGLDILRNFMRI